MFCTGSIPRIHRLSAALANQISAGEVVERPVSVVKELLENALDASASEIIIDIEGAGSGLIRVRDNGQGIHPDDLPLALDRHATSKLNTIHDLNQIASLGFRGEALPSIASVSRFSVVSRTSEHDQAWMMTVDSAEKVPASHPAGTTVEVRDLFYNVPARRKFLKSDKTEFLHIQSLLKAIALSRFGTSFKLRNQGAPVLSYSQVRGDSAQRIADVLGLKLVNDSLPIERMFGAMRLWGWIGSPESARSQTDRQFFYVNGRLIRDRHIIHAVRMAYQDRIYPGRFPCYILYLEMDPSMVDVNVHPAKHEVRFRNIRDVHDLVFGALTEALAQCGLFENPLTPDSPETNRRVGRLPWMSRKNDSARLPDQPPRTFIAPDGLQETGSNYALSNIMNLHDDRYLLLQQSDKPILIDVVEARETIAAFHLTRSIQAGGVEIRPLQIPVSFTLSAARLDFAVTHQDKMKLLGFDLEQISPDLIHLKGFPAPLPYADLLTTFTAVIDCLIVEKNLDLPSLAVTLSQLMAHQINGSMYPRIDNAEIKSMLTDIERVERNALNKKSLPWRYLAPSVWAKLLENG